MEQENTLHLIQPLNFSYPPSISEPSLCTYTGRCCRLLCCVNLYNGIHHSQFLLYHLRSEIPTPSSASPVNPVDPHLFRLVEPRLIPAQSSYCAQQPLSIRPMRYHHTMRSRHGGNRGGATRPGYHPPFASSSPSVSQSPTLDNPRSLGRYSNT